MTDPTPAPRPAGSNGHTQLSGNIRVGAVIALAVAAALITWLIVKDNDDNDGGSGSARPEATSLRDLRAFAGTKDIPVYWAGPRAGYTYELTETDKGNIFIRYLPKGVEVGNRRPVYTTIGTYPYADAYSTLQEVGSREGSRVRRIPGGGIVVVSDQNPKSVYLAFRRQDYQVEVYDPSAKRALSLATSGRVSPIL
jgi:hypothetical protein